MLNTQHTNFTEWINLGYKERKEEEEDLGH